MDIHQCYGWGLRRERVKEEGREELRDEARNGKERQGGREIKEGGGRQERRTFHGSWRK